MDKFPTHIEVRIISLLDVFPGSKEMSRPFSSFLILLLSILDLLEKTLKPCIIFSLTWTVGGSLRHLQHEQNTATVRVRGSNFFLSQGSNTSLVCVQCLSIHGLARYVRREGLYIQVYTMPL